MDAQLFKRLVECNAEQSWELIREVVGIQLMGKSTVLSAKSDSDDMFCLQGY